MHDRTSVATSLKNSIDVKAIVRKYAAWRLIS